MAAPKKNRFAAKPPEELHGESLFVRLRIHEKALIAKAAEDRGLAAWAREVLIKAAEEKIGKQSEPIGREHGCSVSR